MCGINLIIDKQGKLDDTHIQRMNKATSHRGPDRSFYEAIQIGNLTLYLGHNRLKIIDLSDNANQPFYSADKQQVLLFNGEIYNYVSLKNQLKNKYSFKTQSDTEVLLYWLVEKGLEGIAQLEGMFAFVWIDIRQEKVFLVRDSFGIKPLYYFDDDRYTTVSSEIKGILDSGLVTSTLNEFQIGHYLTYKFAQSPQTFFQDIYQVISPCFFDIPNHQLVEIEQTEPIAEPLTPLNITDLESLLIQSVEQQLKADVPVGIFLSGGVDSTLLLSITQELGLKSIPSFSIANDAKETNFGTQDYHYARLAAQQFGGDHQEIKAKPTDLEEFEVWIRRLDQPIADGAIFLTDLLSRFARKSVKVALSGAGADELFAGYNRHQAFYYYLKNYRFFNNLTKRKKLLSSLALDGFAHPWRKKMRLIKKLLQNIDSSPAQTFINFTKPNVIPLNQTFVDSQALPSMAHKEFAQWLTWSLQYDQQHFLAQDVLPLTDAMSMLNSLEVRVPYLSQKLYRGLQHLNPEDLLQQGRKSLLKQWLLKRGGKAFVKRPKEGFGMPFGYWLQQGQLPWVINQLQNPEIPVYKWVNYEGFQKMLKLHIKQKRDYSSEVWSVYLLSEWLNVNVSFYSS
ncbi:MAG TPA: asparagine synthase (glutamine-hydrolyzing) [Microscillaceae bacterium]|nr:asparagine synthase (glutamine-hydrolyzing) [Microscillaceae bacterium]